MGAARTPPPQRRHYLALAIAWTAFAIYGSLVPLQYNSIEWADAVRQFRSLPPLWVGMGSRADWVANILLFVPLAFFWMGALACDRGGGVRTAAALLIVPAATMAAVALEFTQIWFAGRTVSVNDIVAETLGSAIGAVLWLSLGARITRWLRAYSVPQGARSQFEWLLQAYVVGLLVYSVIPLDLTVSFTELYHKWQRGMVLLLPFSYPYESAATAVYQFFADIVEFVPVGVWATIVLRRRTRVASPFVAGVVAGALIAVTIELAQFLVLSRFTDVTDILFGAAGAAIGARLVTRREERAVATGEVQTRLAALGPSALWLAVLAAYSVFLAIGFWFPFDFSGDRELVSVRYQEFFRTPFLALYLGSEFNAIKQALVRILLFAPVGVIWAYLAQAASPGVLRLLVGWVGVAYAAVLALGIEAAQILMPSKVADSTEVLLCLAGAVGGLLVTGRLLGSSPEVPPARRRRTPFRHVPVSGPSPQAEPPNQTGGQPTKRRMLRVVRLPGAGVGPPGKG